MELKKRDVQVPSLPGSIVYFDTCINVAFRYLSIHPNIYSVWSTHINVIWVICHMIPAVFTVSIVIIRDILSKHDTDIYNKNPSTHMLLSQPHVFAAKLSLRFPTSSSPCLHQQSERAVTHHGGFDWFNELTMVGSILQPTSLPVWSTSSNQNHLDFYTSSYMMAKK